MITTGYDILIGHNRKERRKMKKAIVTLVLLALVLTMTCACADSFAYQYGQWWVMDDDGYLHSTTSSH